MLHPGSGLNLLAIENVAPKDQVLQRDAETFLGVDVAEYVGGDDTQSADVISLVQVKYSALHPHSLWTLGRLVREEHGKKGRRKSSVFRKLAAMFDAVAPSDAERPRVVVKLLTNQGLATSLRTELETMKAATATSSPGTAHSILSQLTGNVGKAARQLKDVSGLSWKRFAEFLGAWDLDSFGHAALLPSEAQLFAGIRGAFPDASYRLEALISHLQSAATPGHRVELTRDDVLGFLRLRHDELYPAPSAFEAVSSLFSTSASNEVRQALNRPGGRVVVHGVAGAGKTSALRLALNDHTAYVLYDCFAGGRGLRPGQERFEYSVCFVQVINELEARFNTGVLATTQLSYRSLLEQLRDGVRRAADSASSAGKNLVLAFDAVDNALEQQRRMVGDLRQSFVPILWSFEWPENCLVVVSFRTENEGELGIDQTAIADRVEVQGFNEPEMLRLASLHGVTLSDENNVFLVQRTKGNPRVASAVLSELVTRPSDDAHSIIEATARANAFAYYDQEQNRRLSDPLTRLMLALLYEMRQPPALGTVSKLIGESEELLDRRLLSVRFGVRITADMTIDWDNQDFLEWVGERLTDGRSQARERLVEYCKEQFATESYARWNLSYHLLEAAQYEEVLKWWEVPGRIEEQLAAAQPYEERVLGDIHAIVLACLSLDRDEQAIRWLFRAADLAGGRDAFAHALDEFLAVVVMADLGGLIHEDIAGAARPDPGRSGARARLRHREQRVDIEGNLEFAAALAARRDRHDDAIRLFKRAVSAIQEERARDPEHGGSLRWNAWDAVVRYHVRTDGLNDALKWLEQFESGSFAWTLAAAGGSDWIVSGDNDPLGIVTGSNLHKVTKAAACIGVLGAIPLDEPAGAGIRRLMPTSIRETVASIRESLSQSKEFLADATETDVLTRSERLAESIVAACEQLLAAGFIREALDLTQSYSPRGPWYPSQTNVGAFLRWAAVREAAGGPLFLAEEFEFPLPPNQTEAATKTTHDDSDLKRIRRFMDGLYQPLRARALAWAAVDARLAAEALKSAIKRESPEAWRDQGRWMGSPATNVARLLEGVIALPTRQEELVEEILREKEGALERGRDDADPAITDVLSRDPRYLAIADRLLRHELTRCRPPTVPGTEAVRRLLSFFMSARRIDSTLGWAFIEQARDIAGEIDSLIPVRSTALEQITTAACHRGPERGPDAGTLDQLCALVTYWKGIDVESVDPAWSLRLLALRDPQAAIDRASALDSLGLLPITTGVIAAARGTLAAKILPASTLWPLLALDAVAAFDEFAREVIKDLAAQADLALPLALALAAQRTRQVIVDDSRPPKTIGDAFASWVEPIGPVGAAEAERMQAFVTALEQSGVGDERRKPGAGTQPWPVSVEQRSPLTTAILARIDTSPVQALTRLEGADSAELAAITGTELRSLIASLRDSLPLSDRPRLALAVERWAAAHRRPDDGVIAINELCPDPSSDSYSGQVRSALAESVVRLLDPKTLAIAAHRWSPDLTKAVFGGRWAPPRSIRKTFLQIIALHLPAFDAADLFQLAAQLAELLDDIALTATAVSVIRRTVERLPIPYTPSNFGDPAARFVPKLLARLLRHPEQEIRWRAIYALAQGICTLEEQLPALKDKGPRSPATRDLIDKLLTEFDDQSDIRWMSTREWLSFGFEHIGRRTPWVLTPFVDRLLPHALSDAFPHVGVRGHLAAALWTVHSFDDTVLDGPALQRLEQLHRPIGTVSERGARIAQKSDDSVPMLDDLRDWDTQRYWYAPRSIRWGHYDNKATRIHVSAALV